MIERAVLVAVQFDRERGGWPLADEVRELEELARSSGCTVEDVIQVRPDRPNAPILIGSGKLEEIHDRVHSLRAQVVIFNRELSPIQQRNIENVLGVKTIDRTQLILDIFASRATSQEGKVQVELAQTRYLLPRLTGKGVMLSRLGGGIGTRGPGETKLEVDRRRIRQRIARLTRELEKLSERRHAAREHRRDMRVPVVALIGYTNAGKSTLLNRLTRAGARAENRLFTTLDPLARRLRMPSGHEIILTDTVGFLHHLPHHLIEAFKATLEEAQDANLLLHVLDAAHPMAPQHAEAVAEVLEMLSLAHKPLITVLNKLDAIDDIGRIQELSRLLPNPVAISALDGQGIDGLLAAIEQRLNQQA